MNPNKEHPTPNAVKVMLFLKKRPDITDEKFHQHWREPHVKIALENTTFTSKVRRYNQVHTSPELKAQAQNLGMPVVDYDGIAEVWVDTMEDWKAIVSDEEFIKFIAADELHFIQHPIQIMLCYDNLVIGTDKKTGQETQLEGKTILKQN
ncbi:EthD domain-containing protein [Halenospora varia]|nr:EthD domain-containing protein [Halenospora varia]